MHRIKLRINGKDFEHEVAPRLLLVSYIREKVRLRGTHIGCDTGHCGACTVLFNGQPIKSCMTLAVCAEGAELTTIEGLSEGALHPVQEGLYGLLCRAMRLLYSWHDIEFLLFTREESRA